MRLPYLLIALGALGIIPADAQLFQKPKDPTANFETPRTRLDEKLGRKHRGLTPEEYRSYMWDFSKATMDQDIKIRKNIVQSEETPFWSRRSVWADATMPARAAEFGAGKYAREAGERPTMEDRRQASQLPEAEYSTKGEDDAVLAAVFRHFFGYRAQGFGGAAHRENVRLKRSDVYFLGLGPHIIDVSPSLIAALQNDPALKRDGIVLRPLSKVLEVTDEAIRDRDTGAFGPAFRVDDVGIANNGEVRVLATFTERDGFWFSRELTLRQGKNGWQVETDADFTGL
jgi:hypothetical protein